MKRRKPIAAFPLSIWILILNYHIRSPSKCPPIKFSKKGFTLFKKTLYFNFLHPLFPAIEKCVCSIVPWMKITEGITWRRSETFHTVWAKGGIYYWKRVFSVIFSNFQACSMLSISFPWFWMANVLKMHWKRIFQNENSPFWLSKVLKISFSVVFRTFNTKNSFSVLPVLKCVSQSWVVNFPWMMWARLRVVLMHIRTNCRLSCSPTVCVCVRCKLHHNLKPLIYGNRLSQAEIETILTFLSLFLRECVASIV